MKPFKQWHWFVYIALCKDDTYYTGMTWNLRNREIQHQTGKGSKYTSRHGYHKMVYWEEFTDFGDARKRERQIKGWSREKKENLITGKWGVDWKKKVVK